jgi:hypothetical protein
VLRFHDGLTRSFIQLYPAYESSQPFHCHLANRVQRLFSIAFGAGVELCLKKNTWRGMGKGCPAGPETISAIDECYEPPGAWLTGAFSAVLDGLPQKDAANQRHDDDDEGDLAEDENGR